ncbi:MAG: YibE/F family protein [Spirochaetales bacterium]|nr:YibE/F family protein [Spirochaetales bacterium]
MKTAVNSYIRDFSLVEESLLGVEFMRNRNLSNNYFLVILGALLLGSLLLSHHGNFQRGEIRGRVLEVDNSEVVVTGLAQIGHQILRVELLSGGYRGDVIDVSNLLMGKLDMDTFYSEGDRLYVVINPNPRPGTPQARAVEMIRTGWQGVLLLLFAAALILYAGKVGFRALLSFVISLVILFSILIPALLKGFPPLLITLLVVCLLAAVINYSVAGFNRRGTAALLGTLAGVASTVIISQVFGHLMKLYGYTSPYVESLLYSGHLDLNVRQVFYSSIIIGASGAAMDIAMEVSTSMAEILEKKPEICRSELIRSGAKIGKAVIGTMTTTLLLAYSGSYLTLLMLFQTLETSLVRVMNMKIVNAEILRTLSGSLTLVLVAPLTALIAGWLLKPSSGNGKLLCEGNEFEEAVSMVD